MSVSVTARVLPLDAVLEMMSVGLLGLGWGLAREQPSALQTDSCRRGRANGMVSQSAVG